MFFTFLLNVALAREVHVNEVDHPVYSCASRLTGLACDDPKRLAKQGLKAYVEDLPHGHRVSVVPCVANADYTVYVAFWQKDGVAHPLKFDQWNVASRAFSSEYGLLTSRIRLKDGTLESEGFEVKGKYRFLARAEGVKLQLLEQTRTREDGREELLYWQIR